MTVYVMTTGLYDDMRVVDVFDSEASAHAEIVRAALAGQGYNRVSIEPREVKSS